MMLITKNTDYAIRTLLYMSKNGYGLFSVTDLSKELNISKPFLRRVLQILNKKGILISYKGKGGGFRLALPPQKIYVMDLIKIFQGAIKLNKCFIREELCPDIRTCLLKKKVQEIENYVNRELNSLTIESLSTKKVKND